MGDPIRLERAGSLGRVKVARVAKGIAWVKSELLQSLTRSWSASKLGHRRVEASKSSIILLKEIRLLRKSNSSWTITQASPFCHRVLQNRTSSLSPVTNQPILAPPTKTWTTRKSNQPDRLWMRLISLTKRRWPRHRAKGARKGVEGIITSQVGVLVYHSHLDMDSILLLDTTKVLSYRREY